MFERTLFQEEHTLFRDAVRRFMETEVQPHRERWEEQGYVDREVWLKAGAAGFLCPSMPEQYGGAGADKLTSVVLIEEQNRIGDSGFGFGLHSEIVAPYLLHYGSEELKQAYLPKMASGEMIGAIAMTEPAAGSDLQGIKTTAVKEGDHWLLNGSKTFITNGWHADLVIVVAKTDAAKGYKGISLFVVDTSMPGFSKGKRLKKIGMKLVLKEGYSASTPDLASLVTKLKAARPDVLFHTGYNPDITLFLRQAKELGLRVKAIVGHGAGYGQYDKLREAFREDVDHIFNVDPVASQLLDAKKLKGNLGKIRDEFLGRYKKVTGVDQIPPHASMGFNNTWVLLTDVLPRAIQKYGGWSPEAIQKAALETDIPEGGTIQGYGVKFAGPGDNMRGQNLRASLVVMQYIGGKTQIVYPKAIQTASPVLPLVQIATSKRSWLRLYSSSSAISRSSSTIRSFWVTSSATLISSFPRTGCPKCFFIFATTSSVSKVALTR